MEKYWSFCSGIILVASSSPLRATTPKGPFVVRIVVLKKSKIFLPVAKKYVVYFHTFDVFISIYYVNMIIAYNTGWLEGIALLLADWSEPLTIQNTELTVPFSAHANTIPQTRENEITTAVNMSKASWNIESIPGIHSKRPSVWLHWFSSWSEWNYA